MHGHSVSGRLTQETTSLSVVGLDCGLGHLCRSGLGAPRCPVWLGELHRACALRVEGTAVRTSNGTDCSAGILSILAVGALALLVLPACEGAAVCHRHAAL